MSLFPNVPDVLPNGQSRMDALGIEFAARKGGAGQSPRQTPLSKSSTWRGDLNPRRLCNVDLIVTRRHLDHTSTQRNHAGGAAGTLHSDRRRPDMPEVLKTTSIEHTVRRAKSEAPKRFYQPQNDIVESARATHAAALAGRGRLTTQKATKQLSDKQQSRGMARTHSRKALSPKMCSQSMQLRDLQEAAGSAELTPADCCTPREQISTGERCRRALSQEAFPQELDHSCSEEVLIATVTAPRPHKTDPKLEDNLSTVSTNISPNISRQSSLTASSMKKTLDSPIIGSMPSTPRVIDVSGSHKVQMDRRTARLLEEKMQRMVKAQQKKSMKRAL